MSSRFNVDRVKDVKAVDWDISRRCRREGNEQQRGGGEKTRNRGAGYVGLYIHIYSTSLGVEFTADRTPATTLFEIRGCRDIWLWKQETAEKTEFFFHIESRYVFRVIWNNAPCDNACRIEIHCARKLELNMNSTIIPFTNPKIAKYYYFNRVNEPTISISRDLPGNPSGQKGSHLVIAVEEGIHTSHYICPC